MVEWVCSASWDFVDKKAKTFLKVPWFSLINFFSWFFFLGRKVSLHDPVIQKFNKQQPCFLKGSSDPVMQWYHPTGNCAQNSEALVECNEYRSWALIKSLFQYRWAPLASLSVAAVNRHSRELKPTRWPTAPRSSHIHCQVPFFSDR